MTKEDIIRMAREAGMYTHKEVQPELLDFAALVAAATAKNYEERLKWDIHSCGPTCKRYACVAVREAVLAEREACAEIADIAEPYRSADNIRARSNT